MNSATETFFGPVLAVTGIIIILTTVLTKWQLSIVDKKVLKPTLSEATYNEAEEILSVLYSNGKLIQYKGSSSVWHKLPTMERCDTPLETQLSGIWHYIKHYDGDYPHAHKAAKQSKQARQ